MQRSTAITLLIIIKSLIILPVVCGLAFMLINPYPTDAEMEKFLRDNKTEFETLVMMLGEDENLKTITAKREFWADFQVTTTIDDGRKKTYIDLISKLKILRIDSYERTRGRAFYIKAWDSPGFLIGGKSKFYVYKDSFAPEQEVKSLDTLYYGPYDVNAAKRFDENWSLFLDIW